MPKVGMFIIRRSVVWAINIPVDISGYIYLALHRLHVVEPQLA